MKNYTIKILSVLFPFIASGQVPQEKVVNHQTQTWVSLNTITKFSDKWAAIADAHIRRNDFLADDSFYFLRGGISYIPNANISLNAGYAHMWIAPSNPEWNTFSYENRIYQQAQLNTKLRSVSILQRLRNEQRWQDRIVEDRKDGTRFTNRVRYLASFTIRIFEKNTLPQLVVSDEILLHFGKEVIYNTFDQNRFFLGIRQTINPKWSFDFGYMNVYQQRYPGFIYDMNHTLRLFFYLNTSIGKKAPPDIQNSGDE